jgi:tetratricopeptide (TPR) repeat protein
MVEKFRPSVALGLITLCAAVSFSATAHAGRCYFGKEEHLEPIQDIELKDALGEQLYLGFKFTRYLACLPYSISDDGYVLGIKGKQKYYLLDEDRRNSLQSRGIIPSPLPAYRISTIDRLMGYLLWIALAFVPFGAGFAMLKRRRLRRAVPHYNSGVAHLSRGEFDKAVVELTRAEALAPKVAPILLNRGHAYAAMGAHDQAISDYSKVITLNPKNANAILSRGSVFELSGNLGPALADYTRAVNLTHSEAAHCLRGAARAKANDLDGAIKDFTKASELNPASIGAYKMRAEAYARLGMTELSRRDLLVAAEIAPQRR